MAHRRFVISQWKQALCVAVLISLPFLSPAYAQDVCHGDSVPGEYLVKFRTTPSAISRNRSFSVLSVKEHLRTYKGVRNLHLVRLDDSAGSEKVFRSALSDSNIQYVIPNCRRHIYSGQRVYGRISLSGQSTTNSVGYVLAASGTDDLVLSYADGGHARIPVAYQPRRVVTWDLAADILPGVLVNDGLADFAGVSGSNIFFVLNKGDGTYSNTYYAINVPYATLTSIDSGLYTQDAADDLVVTDAHHSQAVVVTFPNFETYAYDVGRNPQDVVAVDLNGDGLKDVATVNYDDQTVTVLMNNASSLTNRRDYSAYTRPYAIAAGDIDDDGDNDLVVIGGAPAVGSIFYNHGDGTFSDSQTFTFVIADHDNPFVFNPLDIQLADLNKDGSADMLITQGNGSQPGSLFIVPSDHGALKSTITLPTGKNPQELTTADLDGDGDLDILLSNTDDNTVTRYKNLSVETGNYFSFDTPATDSLAGAHSPYGISAFSPDGLAGVTVKIGNFTAITDRFGRFEFPSIPPGTYNVSASRTGYTITLTGGGSVTVGSSGSLALSFDVVDTEVAPPSGGGGGGGGTPTTPPNFYDQLWGLNNTGAQGGKADVDVDVPEAWNITKGAGVIVGVVDTGIDYKHFDIKPNIWTNPNETPGNGVDDDNDGVVDDIHGFNAVTGSGDPYPDSDDEEHATHVAGTIAAYGGDNAGVVGVAPAAKLMSIRFLDNNGGSLSNELAAFDYALTMRKQGVNVRVLNGSFGGAGECTSAELDMLKALNDAGVMFVAAAGNSSANNDTDPHAPANCAAPNVLAVAALDSRGSLAYFSDYGPTTVGVGAPGVGILSTVPYLDNYAILDGTSMAAPHVTGIAALLFAKFPNLTPAQAKKAILDSVKPLSNLNGKIISPGIASAYRALAAAGDIGDTIPPPGSTGKVDLDNPIYTLWNGFINLENILELTNPGDSALDVQVSLLRIDGSIASVTGVNVPAHSEYDVIINDLQGFTINSYGVLKINYTGKLSGRIFYYRPSASKGDYDFAFGIPFTNASVGKTSVGFNTFQPSLDSAEQGRLVANWLSVVNLSTSTKGYTVNKYDAAGNLLAVEHVTVSALGRVDIDGGHVVPGPSRVGINEIVPDDNSAPYLAQLMRYGTSGDGNFKFAFPLLAEPGSDQALDIPLSGTLNAQNWIEVLNAGSNSASVDVNIYDNNGTLDHQETLSLAPKSQLHLEATAFLPAGITGSATIHGNSGSNIITESMFYFRDAQTGSVLSMYGSQGREAEAQTLAGSYNLYLNMADWLKIINPSADTLNIQVTVNTLTGHSALNTVSLAPHATIDLGLQDASVYGTSPDSYGFVQVAETSQKPLLAELLRVRMSPSTGALDFIAPTEVN